MRDLLLTDRLLLRDVTEADAELMLDLDSDPEVMRHIGLRPSPDLDTYRELIRTRSLQYQAHAWHGLRCVFDRAAGEFLGWVFIRPAPASPLAGQLGWTCHSEVEVGYRFRRAAWGRGIATEAAAPLVRIALSDPATSAVVACASRANAASLRVLEKLGLQRVGEVLLSDSDEPTVVLSTRGVGRNER